MRIAFVSTHPRPRHYRQDASFIYRCGNLAHSLRTLGHRVELMHLRDLFWRGRFDVIVFLRPRCTWMLRAAVAWARHRGTHLIGDADDLVFDPDMAQYRPGVQAGRQSEARARAKFASHAAALDLMDGVTLSTRELTVRYVALRPDAKVLQLSNTPSRDWLKVPPAEVTQKIPSISYFSGTHTHDADFGLVAPALKRLLDGMPDLTVRVVGPLQTSLSHPRLLFSGRVGFSDYVHLVRDSYVTIAPLVDTPFARCKSAIKVLESAVMGVPAVASAVGEYAELDIRGILKVPSPDQWEAVLRQALNSSVHPSLAAGLRERVLTRSDPNALAHSFISFVRF